LRFIGLANGYFAEEGLEAKLDFFDTDRAVEKAVAGGKLDIGVASLTGSFFNYAANHRLKIIASQVSDQTGYPRDRLADHQESLRSRFPQHKRFPAQADRHDHS
jgi:ABC-type nitrate/sulfonate/bicarbonate transport system substrate-binding protein